MPASIRSTSSSLVGRIAIASFIGSFMTDALPAAGGAAAEPPVVPAAPTTARSAATADGIAARVRACTTCHGKEGRATNHGYFPRIAGKPAGYLYDQLVNFREGRRNNAAMTYLVSHLSDDYLREIAAHFSALDLPYPPPQMIGAPAAVLARGAALVRHGDPSRGVPACSRCHGEAMTGVVPSMPGLLGLPRDYLVGQFGAWATGERRAAPPDCMAQIVRRLSPDDIGAVATWLSAQPVPQEAHPSSAVVLPLPIECGSGPKR